ncbi:MAG: KamA family radical SAM protein [Myxococcales bacterium]|nr:KamA family radical SAM protein [Myxococcales bacterium]
MRQLARSITSTAELAAALPLTPDERLGAERAESDGLPLRITPHYLSLIDRDDPRCPIRRQCVPLASEGVATRGDMVDPLGEVAHEVAPHLVQRYPDRALLLITDRCALYCRFCTRSRIVGDGGGAVSDAALEPAMRYLETHPEVRDVIVSGGDPLTLATPRLARVLGRVRRIPSVETIRLATRVPVTLPSRITAELVRALRAFNPIWIMTHFNHPRELAPAAVAALERLADGGFPVMNQAVLLRGVNDDPDVLAALFRGLVKARTRPYYLLQMDPVQGTGHLRTPLERSLEIVSALQGRLTGIALPKFIVDTPGGLGKVPLVPDALVQKGNGRTTLRTFRGALVDYVDPS